MLLSVDIGNSTTGLGLFSEPEKSRKPIIKKIPTHPFQSDKVYKEIISEFIQLRTPNSKLRTLSIDAIISSVVPQINRRIIKSITDICNKKPLLVSHRLDCGLTLKVTEPEKIGADRIANAVAGFHYFKKPVAIVDFGTATTITVIGGHKDLLGGAIMPGIGTMQMSLHSWTAKLPSVQLKVPKTALGIDTASAITSGIIHGTAGAVENIIRGIEKEIGFRLKLALTGGYAKLISPLLHRDYVLIPDLTYEGLRLIYIENRTVEQQSNS